MLSTRFVDALQNLTRDVHSGVLDCRTRSREVAATACSVKLSAGLERHQSEEFLWFFGGVDRSRSAVTVRVALCAGLPTSPPVLAIDEVGVWTLVMLRRTADPRVPQPAPIPGAIEGRTGRGADPTGLEAFAFALPPGADEETEVFRALADGRPVRLGELRAIRADPHDGSGPFVQVRSGRFGPPRVARAHRDRRYEDPDAGSWDWSIGVQATFGTPGSSVETFWRREPLMSSRRWASFPLPVGVFGKNQLYIPGNLMRRRDRDPLVVVSFDDDDDDRYEVDEVTIAAPDESQGRSVDVEVAVRAITQIFLEWQRAPASFVPETPALPQSSLGLKNHELRHGRLFDLICNGAEAASQAIPDGWALRSVVARYECRYPDAHVDGASELRVEPDVIGRLRCAASSELPSFLRFPQHGGAIEFSPDDWEDERYVATPSRSFGDEDIDRLFLGHLRRWAEV